MSQESNSRFFAITLLLTYQPYAMRIGYETIFYPDCNATTLTEAETTSKCPTSAGEPFLAVAKALIPEPILLLKDYAVSFAQTFKNISDSEVDFETLAHVHGYVDSILYSNILDPTHSQYYSYATPKRQADFCLYVNRYHVSLAKSIDAAFWLEPLPVWLWVAFFALSLVLCLLFRSLSDNTCVKLLFLLLSFQDAVVFIENAGLKADALQNLVVRFPYETLEDVLRSQFRYRHNVTA